MAADDDQPDDTAKKVKDLVAAFARASAPRRPVEPAADDKPAEEEIDPQTRAELERWFGLPSYQELAERPQAAGPVVDEEMMAVRERRAKAIANVDPAFVEAHRKRVEPDPDRELPQPLPPLRTFVSYEMALFDQGAIDRGFSIAEPREVDIPQQLIDDLHECTPQALLRDLHRAEFDFEKVFEVIDHGAELRVDIGARVGELMTTRYADLPRATVFADACADYAAERVTTHARPWVDVLTTYLPNRREGMS